MPKRSAFRSSGSSPRMRGTLRRCNRGIARPGIIPAHAGNTSLIRHYEQNLGDHPRACGEHWLAARRVERRAGSSPRMRGTPLHDLVFRCQRGIIPAHAGNTSIGRSKFRSSWDHPRACGEHPFPVGLLTIPVGSSPRMRGTLPGKSTGLQTSGIIPAHAGNTSIGRSKFRSSWDHPRACGEHP